MNINEKLCSLLCIIVLILFLLLSNDGNIETVHSWFYGESATVSTSMQPARQGTGNAGNINLNDDGFVRAMTPGIDERENR